MGTLTYDCPRLDSHCPHKLATSCRLTSTHNCCACADERVHSRTYRVYIDGIGFVQRGTRWQGYCWFCKEFWTNRLAATDPPLEVSQTRIPEIPDQTEFLDKWFEFHQGYRIAKLPDGTEQRIAVIGEPFKEVSPGFLPRTLDQLRNGVENDAQRPENRLRRRRLSSEEQRTEESQQSLDSALDSLLDEATQEEAQTTTDLSEMSPEQELGRELGRQLAARFLHTEQSTPQPVEPPQPRPPRSHATRQPTAGEALLRRNRERFARVFGTREDIQRDDYESPLSTMYNRAYDRYRQAEERRATGTTEPPPLDGLSARERREIEEQLLWGVMRESRNQQLEQEGVVWSYAPAHRQESSSTTPIQQESENSRRDLSSLEDRQITRRAAMTASALGAGPSSEGASSARRGMEDVNRDIQRIQSELQRLRQASEALAGARRPDPPAESLDSQPDRPSPLTEEQMTKNLSCQVCYQQLADIAVLPCGHMIMCQWCADVVIPVKHSHLPARPNSKCPMCRKTVKQRFKIHM